MKLYFEALYSTAIVLGPRLKLFRHYRRPYDTLSQSVLPTRFLYQMIAKIYILETLRGNASNGRLMAYTDRDSQSDTENGLFAF